MKMKTCYLHNPPSRNRCALSGFSEENLEGDRLDFKRFAICIILWSIRCGFDNFSTPSFHCVCLFAGGLFRLAAMAYGLHVRLVSIIFFIVSTQCGLGSQLMMVAALLAQRVFDECPLISANIHHHIIFFYGNAISSTDMLTKIS